MTCLDANAVQEYLRGRLDDVERARIDEHLDGCDDCRALIAAAAELAAGGERSPAEDVDPLHLGAGERIGRFVIVDRIGGGAMGIVYAAADPELQRRVAIKLLTSADPKADERLRREAQALARV